MTSVSTLVKRAVAWMDRALFVRLLTLVYTFAGRAVRKRQAADWKTRVLGDFSDWLDSLDPDRPPNSDPDPEAPGPDLYSLMAEFAALQKEIRLQNREQSRQIRGLADFNEFAGQGRQILAALAAQVDRLEAREDRARDRAVEEILQAFLEVRAPLARGAGLKSGAPPLVTGRKKLLALLEGYRIALGKFDQALARLDTVPIDTAGRAFDPETMMAVDTCDAGKNPPGTVAEEISGGFMRQGRVLRTAGVVVYAPEHPDPKH